MSYKYKIVTVELAPEIVVHHLYQRTKFPWFIHLGQKWEFVKSFDTKKAAEAHIQLIKTYPREKTTAYYYASGNEDVSW
jgi:hypothetical protein